MTLNSQPLYVLFASSAKHAHSSAIGYSRLALFAISQWDQERYQLRADALRKAAWDHLRAAREAKARQ
jgi:hypothetical protein